MIEQHGIALLDALAIVGDVLFAGHREDVDRMRLRGIAAERTGGRRGAGGVGPV